MKLQSFINKLNPQQRKAVETIEGPVMVVAGPGTGKTQILALRIANILSKTDVSASNILCLTFTESGVRAMRQRLIQFIGNEAYKVVIHTFHSFANEIIQTFPEKFAVKKELVQLDEVNRIKIMQRILDNNEAFKNLAPFHNKYGKISEITSAIKTLKQEAITPGNLENKAREIKNELNEKLESAKSTATALKAQQKKVDTLLELTSFYEAYKDELEQNGYYDYEDMILFATEKLQTDEELLAHYQEKFLYILVDEYQDTNGAQNNIIKTLGNFDKSPNIFVVGDDDQAIYRFQGANLDNILFFNQHFEGVQVIPVTTNYRSSTEIVKAAESVIKNNKTRLTNQIEGLSKVLDSAFGSNNNKISINEFNTSEEETYYIAEKIKDLKSQGVNYSDIAIIHRRHTDANDILQTFANFQIPFQIDTSKSILNADSVKQLVNILNAVWVYDKSNDLDLYQVLNYPFSNIDVVDVYRMTSYINQEKLSFFELLLMIQLQDSSIEKLTLKLKNKEQIIKFVNQLIDWHKKCTTTRVTKLVNDIMFKSGLIDFYSVNQQSITDLLALTKFFEFVKQIESSNPKATILDLLADIKIVEENKIEIKVPKPQSVNDAVNVLTAHSSKGLEFKHVFIIRCTSINWGVTRLRTGLLPPQIYSISSQMLDKNATAMEDERRLFYVAMTRAKETVTITSASEYASLKTVSKTVPSQFILEIDSKYVQSNASRESDAISIPARVGLLKSEEIISISEDEKTFLKEQVEKFKLSPTSLNMYLKSPLEFKLQHLIKVPKPKDKILVLGTAIHEAFQLLNSTFDESSESFASLESMIKTFENKLYKEFGGDEEYSRTLEKGKQMITDYYNYYIASGSYKRALAAEYNFSYHNVFLDIPGQEPIQLSGKVDKIELISQDAASGIMEVKVVDYKSGRAKTENEVKGTTKSSDGDVWRQLVFYKLMADLDPNFRPSKSPHFNKYVCNVGEVDFLDKDKKIGKYRKYSFVITQKDVQELKELIIDVVKRIRNLEFS